MKTYFPYYFRKIGIAFVIIAFGLSFYANINDFLDGFAEGRNKAIHNKEELMKTEYHIISDARSHTFTWISLAFSLADFYYICFLKKKRKTNSFSDYALLV